MRPDLTAVMEQFSVSRESFEKMLQYQGLLKKWQKAVNLVSNKTLEEAWERHFLDSAQLLPLIPDDVNVLADLGCGGGFPGLVLAMCRPDLDVHLVESDEKKCQFMRTVSRETQTPVSIHTMRIEAAYEAVQPDLITARALASLEKLLGYASPWAAANPALKMLFLKGENAASEIEDARRIYDFEVEDFPSETDPLARILYVQNLRRK